MFHNFLISRSSVVVIKCKNAINKYAISYSLSSFDSNVFCRATVIFLFLFQIQIEFGTSFGEFCEATADIIHGSFMTSQLMKVVFFSYLYLRPVDKGCGIIYTVFCPPRFDVTGIGLVSKIIHLIVFQGIT